MYVHQDALCAASMMLCNKNKVTHSVVISVFLSTAFTLKGTMFVAGSVGSTQICSGLIDL